MNLLDTCDHFYAYLDDISLRKSSAHPQVLQAALDVFVYEENGACLGVELSGCLKIFNDSSVY